MQKVTFTNSRGDSIELYQSPFFLNKIEGLGDVEADIQNQKAPGQDGSTHIDSLLEERYIPLEVVILKDLLTNRQLISKVFNPKLGQGLLTYTNDIVTREILAIPEHVPKFDDIRPRKTQNVTIDLICPNPFWLDQFTSSKKLSYTLGGLTFPLQLGTGFSQRGFRSNISNTGDISTPVKIEFYGPATNPVIKNLTTKEQIKVNRTLTETDVLIINTEFGNKSVIIVDGNGTETNVFNWIDLSSTFWSLIQGNNLIEYGSDNDATKSKVVLSYHNRFLSV